MMALTNTGARETELYFTKYHEPEINRITRLRVRPNYGEAGSSRAFFSEVGERSANQNPPSYAHHTYAGSGAVIMSKSGRCL